MKFNFSVLVILLFSSVNLFAQNDYDRPGFFGRIYDNVFMGSGTTGGGNVEEEDNPYKNIVKLNISGLSSGSYEAGYERGLSKHFSASITGKFQPEKSVPFGEQLAGGSFGDSTYSSTQLTSLVFDIGDFKTSSFYVNPEIRFYMPGPLKGLYFGAYGRYRNNKYFFPVSYTNTSNQRFLYELKGDISSTMGGLKIGTQFNIKRFVIDISIFGVHSASHNGNISVTTNNTLTATEMNDINSSLQSAHDIISYVFKYSYTLEPNKITITPEPSIGFVAGNVMIGFRF
ncbi:MAG: hypothetical protein KA275_08285 [Chitinophagaceae bacterium]|nr:hypothetical protein [Chitinophagaceae bacterium]